MPTSPTTARAAGPARLPQRSEPQGKPGMVCLKTAFQRVRSWSSPGDSMPRQDEDDPVPASELQFPMLTIEAPRKTKRTKRRQPEDRHGDPRVA